MINRPDIKELEKKAKEIRKDILIMLERAGSGHSGGSLSVVEILMALFYYKMRHHPKEPDCEERDRFFLSKGHVCPALYTVLAHAGYFPRKELLTLRKFGSRLQGHPDKNKLPCLESSSGSLGQGLSLANGTALAFKMDKKPNRVYCLMSDGEQQEGQIWEAAMTGVHYKLDNVCGIIDYNKLQIDGFVKDVKNIEPLADKWKAFGWHVLEVEGHSFKELMDGLDEAETVKGKPTCIIAHTVKGKGVSFMENRVEWHGVPPKKDQLDLALKELVLEPTEEQMEHAEA